jgi:hypothetical protein
MGCFQRQQIRHGEFQSTVIGFLNASELFVSLKEKVASDEESMRLRS